MTVAAETLAARRKRVKLVGLLGLLLALAVFLGFLASYLISLTRREIDISGAPSYERSIYGSPGLGALSQPMGAAVDSRGNLYVVDTDRRRVQVFDEDGALVARFPREKEKKQLVNPLYVAVEPRSDNVFVSDRGTGKLLVFSPQGRFIREFKPKGQPGFRWAPAAVVFDRAGNLYVTDFGSQQLRVFDRKGRLVRSIRKAGVSMGEFQFPNGIAVDENRIYVSDSNNGRIEVFDKNGKALLQYPVGGLPRGIALDSLGRLYVVDTLEHQVKVFRARDGQALFTFASFGQGDGQFLFPNSVVFDGLSRIYITDRENNRVTVWGYGN